jgi:hypothetical protein
MVRALVQALVQVRWAVQLLWLQCSALARMTALQRRAVRRWLQRMALTLLWPRRMALALVTGLQRQEVSPGFPPSMSAVSPCRPFMPLRVIVLWRQCTAMALVTARQRQTGRLLWLRRRALAPVSVLQRRTVQLLWLQGMTLTLGTARPFGRVR